MAVRIEYTREGNRFRISQRSAHRDFVIDDSAPLWNGDYGNEGSFVSSEGLRLCGCGQTITKYDDECNFPEEAPAGKVYLGKGNALGRELPDEVADQVEQAINEYNAIVSPPPAIEPPIKWEWDDDNLSVTAFPRGRDFNIDEGGAQVAEAFGSWGGYLASNGVRLMSYLNDRNVDWMNGDAGSGQLHPEAEHQLYLGIHPGHVNLDYHELVDDAMREYNDRATGAKPRKRTRVRRGKIKYRVLAKGGGHRAVAITEVTRLGGGFNNGNKTFKAGNRVRLSIAQRDDNQDNIFRLPQDAEALEDGHILMIQDHWFKPFLDAIREYNGGPKAEADDWTGRMWKNGQWKKPCAGGQEVMRGHVCASSWLDSIQGGHDGEGTNHLAAFGWPQLAWVIKEDMGWNRPEGART